MNDITSLSLGQVKQLRKLERDMDSGEVPYVRLEAHRVSMTQEAMQQFDLQTGQTISETIFREILNFNLAQIKIQRDTESLKD